MKPFKLFIHATNIVGKTIRVQEVLDDIFSYIFSSGFINDCEQIIICTCGDPIKLINHEKIKLQVIDDRWELQTLTLLQNFCFENTGYNVLFAHCKGTTVNGIPGTVMGNYDYQKQDDWRKFMCYFNIAKYKECIKVLENNDTCGVNYQIDEANRGFYSGNFWWATSDYIKTLPKVESINISQNRYMSEKWLGMNMQSHKAFCMHNSHTHHYNERCPKELYEEN